MHDPQQRRAVLRLAIASRLVVVAWSIVADAAFPDHRSDARLYLIGDESRHRWLLTPFTRWDSAWFLSIARDGYTHKSETAFFPGYPWLVRAVARLVPGSRTEATVVAAVAVSNVSFVVAADAVRHVAGPAAARAFCLSPAAVFFSTAYSESLFAALTFQALARSRPWPAAVLLSCATAVRANGVLAACLVDTLPQRLLVLLPAALHDLLSRARFRTEEDDASWPPPLSFYASVQHEFWHLGFARYWRLRQLPNFLLAAPAIALALSSSDHPRPIRLHTLATLCLLLALAHVQIATRLLAASSLPFLLAIAHLRRRPPLRAYLALYALAGTAAHVNGLPWT